MSTYDSVGKNGSAHFAPVRKALPDDEAVLTKAKRGKKAGKGSGYNDSEQLMTPSEAEDWVDRGRNVGIALGEDTRYVTIDVEQIGTLPDEAAEIVDDHALITWDSPHGGRNRLLRVTSDAYDILDGVKRRIDLDGDGKHEVEILKSTHALLPGSIIDHEECKDSKENCPGEGWGVYDFRCSNPDAPELVAEGAEAFLEAVGVENDSIAESSERDEIADASARDSDLTEAENLPELTAKEKAIIDGPEVGRSEAEDAMEDVLGEGTLIGRLATMKTEWRNGQKVGDLLLGKNRAAGYSDRSSAEMTLARYIGFAFDRNLIIAKYVFEEVGDLDKYHENKWHRRDMYRAVKGTEWVYDNRTAMPVRREVAQTLADLGSVDSVQELANHTGYSCSTCWRALDYFRREEAVDGPDPWTDTNLSRFLDLYPENPEEEEEEVTSEPLLGAVGAD